MTAADPGAPVFIDPERMAHLYDVGLPGYVAAWCMTANGAVSAWLINEVAVRSGLPVPHGDPCQPHEGVGPLPARLRYRIALAPLRCGRRRVDGRRCRRFVRTAGQPCGRHSDRAGAP